MEQKKNSTTIFIFQDLELEAGSFTKDIRVPFAPKTVTVSNLLYVYDPDPAAKEGRIDLISSDIIQTLDGVIGAFFDGMTSPPPLTLPCSSSVNGFIKFDFTNNEVREGDIAFALTFKD